MLAWIRTGIALMGFGFVVARFGWFLREFASRDIKNPPSAGWSLILGVGFIGLGVILNVLAGIEYLRFFRRHDEGLPYQHPSWSLGILAVLVLTVLGLIMATYLLALGME